MLYPAYVRRNKDATCQVTFPDFKSCFPNIKGRSYLTHSFKKTIESYIREKNLLDILPSTPRDWFADSRFRGGYWTLIDISPESEEPVPTDNVEIKIARLNS